MEDGVRRVGLPASVVVTLVAAYGLLVVGPVGTRGGPARAQAAEQQLDTRQGLYPRVIRLEHSGPANGRIIASVSASSTGGITDIARIYESTDAGASFHQRRSSGHGERAPAAQRHLFHVV
jgi:hypothetical protein